MSSENQIALSANGAVATVTVSEEGAILTCDKLDILQKEQWEKVLAATNAKNDLHSNEPFDKGSIEQERCAATADAVQSLRPTAIGELEEMGDHQVVRTERFSLPSVSGRTVPTRTQQGGRPSSEWQLILQQEEDSREAMPLPECLDAGDGQVFGTKAVAALLRRYTTGPMKANGRRISEPSIAELKRVQSMYDIDLGMAPNRTPKKEQLSSPTDSAKFGRVHRALRGYPDRVPLENLVFRGPCRCWRRSPPG